MQVTTSEATIVACDKYGEGNDGKQIAYKGGAPVLYVEVLFDGEQTTRRITLARDVDPVTVPTVGEVAHLDCEVIPTVEGYAGQDGRIRTRNKDKWRCLGFRAASTDDAAIERRAEQAV